jgi:hypothetical protein
MAEKQEKVYNRIPRCDKKVSKPIQEKEVITSKELDSEGDRRDIYLVSDLHIFYYQKRKDLYWVYSK